MSSLNKVQLIGNVGADPEIRSLNSGDRCANLRIATSQKWKDKSSGESKEKTEWHKIVVFGDGLVGVIEKYVSKGSKIFVEGALQTRKWDKDGVDHYSTEIVLKPFNGQLILLGGKGEGGDQSRGGYDDGGGSKHQRPATGGGNGGFQADLDDEIPF